MSWAPCTNHPVDQFIIQPRGYTHSACHVCNAYIACYYQLAKWTRANPLPICVLCHLDDEQDVVLYPSLAFYYILFFIFFLCQCAGHISYCVVHQRTSTAASILSIYPWRFTWKINWFFGVINMVRHLYLFKNRLNKRRDLIDSLKINNDDNSSLILPYSYGNIYSRCKIKIVCFFHTIIIRWAALRIFWNFKNS